MLQLNDDLARDGATFSRWTETQIGVLEILPLCGNLLAWLDANIKDRNDLKTFYDLATISAGESDHELDRVSHFYQAVSAYAPLILDLPADASFQQFQAAAQAVFNAMAADPHIATKLVDSNRNLEWIKACKDQQGSVEQSSLTLVAKINQTGIFQLGRPPTDRKATAAETMSRPEDCIKVFYHKVSSYSQDVEEGRKMQELTMAELKELNSKLMLITAGTDGKRDVERFSRILGLVERVGRHFIDLLNAGCHLFSQWSLKVQLNTSIYNKKALERSVAEPVFNILRNLLKREIQYWRNHK